MASVIRQRLVSRWLGDGLGGMVGAGLLGWGFRKLRGGLRREPEVLDVARLVPGEQYTVVTRPAPSRRERRLQRRFDRRDHRARRVTAPSRPQRRSARQLARVERRIAKVDPASSRAGRLVAERDERRARHDALCTLTSRQRRALDARDRAGHEVTVARDATLARVRRRTPPPRRRTFR